MSNQDKLRAARDLLNEVIVAMEPPAIYERPRREPPDVVYPVRGGPQRPVEPTEAPDPPETPSTPPVSAEGLPESLEEGLLQLGGLGDLAVNQHDGWARFAGERADTPDPGTAHPKGVELAADWEFGGGGFVEDIPGYEWPLLGPKNANQGGAEGIYPHIDWWAGCKTGLEGVVDAAIGAAQRMRIWAGKPDEPYDKIRRDLGPHGFNQYNDNHLGRIGHYAYYGAKHGVKVCQLILRTLADDVRRGWCDPGFALYRPEAYGRWSCHEILDYYPPGQGCHLMGRGFGHVLTVLANAEEIFPGRYTADLELMAKTIRHVWNEEHAYIGAIPALDPIWGRPLDAYKKKLKVDQERIPPGEFPKIQRVFEEVIVWEGAMRANARLAGTLNGITFPMVDALRARNRELRVINHPDWDDPDTALGTLNMLGLPGDRWNGGKTAEELIPTKMPYQDHVLNSWHPSLWPAR